MRIGVVGSGNMGRSLGLLCNELGHEVLFGARREQQARAAAELAGARASWGKNSEVAAFGEVVIWNGSRSASQRDCVRWGSACGRASDRYEQFARTGGGTRTLAQLHGEADAIRAARGSSRKSVLHVRNRAVRTPPALLDQHEVSVFLASDHEAAKEVTAGLVRSMGCMPVDCDRLAHARVLERLGDLVRILIRQGHPLTVALSVKDLAIVAAPRPGGRKPSQLS